jgi:hypothetical protein
MKWCAICCGWALPLHKHWGKADYTFINGQWRCRWCKRVLENNRVLCSCPESKGQDL